MPPTDHTNCLRGVQEWSWETEVGSEIFEEVEFDQSFENESEDEHDNELTSIEDVDEVETPKTRWNVNNLEMESTNVCRRLNFNSNVCRRLRFDSNSEDGSGGGLV